MSVTLYPEAVLSRRRPEVDLGIQYHSPWGPLYQFQLRHPRYRSGSVSPTLTRMRRQAYLVRSRSPVEFGPGVALGPGVHIYTVDHPVEPYERMISYVGPAPYLIARRVKIGSNVVIGGQSMILPGVTIGDHVYVGAGSVVTKDVESFTLVAGNPARVIRRFDEEEAKGREGWEGLVGKLGRIPPSEVA